ncbi:MAG: hypothetical protein K2K80_02705 [Clostridia bacterium]|nr:hypothetical protein [Clostridia bacterium]
MKKTVLAIFLAAAMAIGLVPFSACAPEAANDGVTLVDVTREEVGVRSDIDYFVVAEPAASVKVNAIESLEFSGNLQMLYGGENGYPQAVVVIKNELLNYSVAPLFRSALAQSKNWLSSESTTVQTIVSAVNSHISGGASPTFTDKNLSKQVIENCGINFVYAAGQVDEVTSFMGKLNAVSETSFGTPAKKFFLGDYPAVEMPDYDGKITVYMPDGAPALGMAKLMAEEDTFYNGQVEFNVVNASIIQTFVTGNDLKADICVLPVNMAVKLLGKGDKYKLLGTLTHGNLYMVSNGKTAITPDNISNLKGKTVGVVNLSQIPGLTFKLILKNGNIPFTEQH